MTYLNDAIPLIVCGRQRAGTRFITQALNSFYEVSLQGEIPNPVMKSAIRFISDCNKFYANAAKSETSGTAQLRRWERKRVQLMFEIWAGASQSNRQPIPKDCKYIGYKRPNNEQFFEFYESVFINQKPRYIYCIRNFRDNFLSISSRWPERTIDQVAKDYLGSLDQLEKMKAAAPERVLVFDLDEHIRSGWSYAETAILMPLGLKPRDDAHRDVLALAGPINTTEAIIEKPRRKELTAEELVYLYAHPALVSRPKIVTGVLLS
jgi:hypothetical protein